MERIINPNELVEGDTLTHTEEEANRKLGRLVSIDTRDNNFLMASRLPSEAPGIIYRYWWVPKVLDQGYTSHCVAYSGQLFLESGPITNPSYGTPKSLYDECQQNDEWEGAEPTYYGTSVRALFKVLRNRGYINEYSWAFDISTVVKHLLLKGPVILGTDWYNSMFYPDKEGWMKVDETSGFAGGHAYLVKGCNVNKMCPDGSRGAIRIVNSWGREWGDDGYAWMSFNDAHRLIRAWGEACTATELKFKEEAKG